MKTIFRALVMLGVLVGLPAAWIYYGPLPESAQHVVDRFVSAAKEATGWDKPATPPDALAATAPAPRLGSAPAAQSIIPSTVTSTLSPRAAASPLEPLLAQLRDQGVVEYALERWGARGELYRFHCEMPLGAGGGFTQQFEGVAADPRASIELVVADVASWRLARGGERFLR